MNEPRNPWGVAMPHGSFEWEGTKTYRASYTPRIDASDQALQSTVVLYGPRGETLIRREPRKVGFRKP